METLNRRRLMGWMGLLGYSGLTASAAAAVGPRPNDEFKLPTANRGCMKFSVDVALLGHTDAPNTSGRIGDPQSHEFFGTDARGDSFYVEGLLYPGGTIPTPTTPTAMAGMPNAPLHLNNQIVWDFKATSHSGLWFSRGWILINGNPKPYTDANGTTIDTLRTEPFLLADHTFAFGRFEKGQLQPEMLITSGTEGRADPDAEASRRAVTGGTGRFADVSGQVIQTRLGRNTSTLRSLAKLGNVNAPNYRFEFDLRLG